MSVESTLNEIRDLLAEANRGRAEGNATETVNVNITSSEVEEANAQVTELRKELVRLRDEQQGYAVASQEYKEIAEEIKNVQSDLNGEYKRTQDELKNTRENQLALTKALEAGKKAFIGLSSRINDVQSLSRELERTGAASKELSRDAIKLGDQLRLSLGEDAYEDMTQATKALVSGVTDFTMVSKEQQKSLMKDAALFNEVGVSNEQYTKNIQVGMKALGMSSAEAADSMRDMRKTALALQVPVTELMDDFAGAEEKLAQLGDTGVTSFKEMARIQKITGLEMGKLIQMTDKFDTFEGAAEAAGSLNAALGGNFVDSMSLMMEDDPAERFKIIRDAIESSGQSLDTMSRKQKMFMAGQLDMSVADFTKAMSGDLSALEGSAEAAADAAGNEIKSLEDSATLIRSQTELAANFALAMEPAYGTLADKAMNVTDEVSYKFYDMAQAANEAQIAIAEMTPDILAAAAGSIEGAANTGDKFLGIFKSVEGALMLLLAAPGKLFTAFNKVKEYFGKGGRFRSMITGAFEMGKNGVIGFRDAFKNGFSRVVNIGKSAIGKVKGILDALRPAFTKVANVGSKFGNTLARLGRGFTTFGKTNPITIAIFGMIDGFFKVKEAAGDFADYLGGGFIGAFGAFAELGDFIFGGFIGDIAKFFGTDLGDTGLLSLIGQGVNSLIGGVEMSFADAWDALDWGFIGETFEFMFDEAIKAVKDILGISSPSKVMMDIGSNMITSIVDTIIAGGTVLAEAAGSLIDKFIAPWTTIGSLLMEVIQPALDMVPDSIKNLFMGDTAQVAGELQTAAVVTPATAAAALGPAEAGGGADRPQVINISLNMDGKEIDKKVINLLGGVVKEAVL